MHSFYKAVENDILRVTIGHTQKEGQPQYFLSAIDVKYRQEWKLLLSGLDNGEFSTSLGQADALSCRVSKTSPGETKIILEGESDYWSARESFNITSQGTGVT